MNELMKLKEHHYTNAKLEVSDIQRREIALRFKELRVFVAVPTISRQWMI